MFCFVFFFFSGKVRIVKLVSVSEDFVSAMALLDEEDEPYVAVKDTLERLVCSLYEVKLEIDVNETRYKLFAKKRNHHHLSLRRVRFRVGLGNINASCGKKALDYHPHLPHCIEHGWTDIDGSLAVQ